MSACTTGILPCKDEGQLMHSRLSVRTDLGKQHDVYGRADGLCGSVSVADHLAFGWVLAMHAALHLHSAQWKLSRSGLLVMTSTLTVRIRKTKSSRYRIQDLVFTELNVHDTAVPKHKIALPTQLTHSPSLSIRWDWL